MSALSFCQPGSLYLWEEKPSISEYQFQMKGSLMILDYCSYIVSTQVPLCLISALTAYICAVNVGSWTDFLWSSALWTQILPLGRVYQLS